MLIDPSTRLWNHGINDGVFAPEEADLIKNIPLARMESEDSLIWPLTQDGCYSCKSGYCFLKEEAEFEGGHNEASQDKGLWMGTWALLLLNKRKNMVWRACRNSLPTKKNLVGLTIIDLPICDCCQNDLESVIHALWSYREVDVVQFDVELWNFWSSMHFMHFESLVAWILQENKRPTLFIVTMWSFWNQHNQV